MRELPEGLHTREWIALERAWPSLPRRAQDAILVLAGVVNVERIPSASERVRARPGEAPSWLIQALNLLKDSKGYMPDREIARRLRVNQSTLSRSKVYQQARQAYLQPVRNVVRRAPRKKPR